MGVIEHPALTPQWLTPLQAAEYLVHVDGCARGLLVIEVQSKGEKMTARRSSSTRAPIV